MNKFQDIKKYLDKAKKNIKNSFSKKQDGLLAAIEQTNLTDEILRAVFQIHSKNNEFKNTALCAIGGYGRSQLAPFSDIDIIFLINNHIDKEVVEKDIRETLYKLWDLDFKIGYSVRKINEIFSLSIKDQIIATSLLDCRFICGNYQTYKKAQTQIKRIFKNQNAFIGKKIVEQEKRFLNNNEIPFLVEPDIKNSIGGLRDLNLIFWFFKTRYSSDNLDILLDQKIISHYEYRKLNNLKKFLLKVRFHLHFIAGRANDKLTLNFQKKIATLMGYKSKKKTLGVEKFMRHFYLQARASNNLLNIVFGNFIDKKPLNNFIIKFQKLFFKGNYLKKENYLLVTDSSNFFNDPKNILFFFYKCLKDQLLPHSSALRLIFNKIQFINSTNFNCNVVKSYFLKILIEDKNNNIFEIMHSVGVISKLIPQFSRIVCQAQFDQYHLFTVDQHTIKALNTLKKIDYGEETKNKYLFASSILERIKNKKPLYLATLFHDIGKGYECNHNVIGSRIAKSVCEKFDLSVDEIDDITWLVANHQKFCDLAFKSDLEDREIIKNLSSSIKKPEILMALFVLTVIDISSVNEGILTEWKLSLIVKLYKKCEEEMFLPDRNMHKKNLVELQQQKSFESTVVTSYPNFKKFVSISSNDFWLMQSAKKISQQIDLFFNNESMFHTENYGLIEDNINGFLELTVLKKDRKELLIDLVNTILVSEMKIFEARVFTLKNKMAIDIFKISPLQFKSEFNKEDVQYYKNILKKNLKAFFERNLSRKSLNRQSNRLILNKKVSINFNNQNNYFTRLNVKTHDRQFLLLDILEAIIKCKCEVYSAKISTFGNLIEDIFYIKKNGRKITSNKELLELKQIIKNFVIHRG